MHAWTSAQARIVILALLLLTLVGCDQATKRYAISHLQHTARQPITFLDETCEIRFARNDGAFLSLFAGLSRQVRFWILTVMNGVILSGIAVLLIFRRGVDRWSFFALALLLAGGIGNLIDRIWRGGIVIDFLVIDLSQKTGIPWLKTGIFNVADIAITCGFFLLLPHLFRKEPARPVEAPA